MVKKILKTYFPFYSRFAWLERKVIDLNNVTELKKLFNWNKDPILDRPNFHEFDYIEDINERRIRDAESIATVTRNVNARNILEIGTANGQGTVLLAVNAPDATIHTINIPPDQALSGEGGKLTTYAPSNDEIGNAYKERGFKNINQILANTATWKPNIGQIDIAVIDGCHDTRFVINDTKKVMPFMRKSSFILWHDFNLDIVKRHSWIDKVCFGIEMLYRQEILNKPIFHIKDSWVGIYEV
jgi:hypothetical protein